MTYLEKINNDGVSIIIGARNEYPQVAMTIGNIMEDMHASGITKWEIILMDNGSDDETSRFFTYKQERGSGTAQERSGRTYYIPSPRGLISEGRLRIFFDPLLSNVGTRNKGVIEAKYQNIIFSDAHQIIRPGTIYYVLETLNKFGGIVHAPISWMGASPDRPDPGYQYSYKVGEKIWGCVDDQTELLTKNGWKYYNQVDENTVFATINRDTLIIEYQKADNITKRVNYRNEAIRIHNNDVDMLLTPDHRTLVNNLDVIPAKDVCEKDKIPVASLGTVGSQERQLFDAIVGWVLTDGGYDYKEGKYPRVRIFQKKEPQKKKIREDLELAGISFFEFEDKYGKSIFTINAKDSRKIVDLFPERKLTIEYVCEMSQLRSKTMLDRMLRADGSGKTFYKTDKDFVDAFQMLCVHAGESTKYRYKKTSDFKGNRYGKRGIYNVVVGNTRQYKTKISKVKPNGCVMWCPTMPNGTIVARRNGKVYYTGNTWNKVKVAEEAFYIPICGHAFLAVRKDEFLSLRGYPYAQRVYGGGEPYLDTKYWMMGSTSMMEPRALVYHLSAGRGYSWHNNDLIHNMFLVSYIMGGEKWADRILMTYYNKSPGNESFYDSLYAQARRDGQEDKDWLDSNRKMTFEDVLGLDITEGHERWCTKCTKRGYSDPHAMRPWDSKNEELHGTHRSWVAEFKLTRDDQGRYFIGSTQITSEKAIEIAKKYL